MKENAGKILVSSAAFTATTQVTTDFCSALSFVF